MKKSAKCVFLHVRGELAKNFPQTKKSKKCWVKCSQSGQRPRVRGGGVQKSKNSSQMKKAKKCVFLHVRGELAKNSTQTKKWEKRCVICSQAGQRAGVCSQAGLEGGGQNAEKSSQMKKSKKSVFLHLPGELAKNSTQTKKSKKNCRSNPPPPTSFCKVKIANRTPPSEMRFSPRTRRTRKELHANEEMGETLCHMFPSWPKSRS